MDALSSLIFLLLVLGLYAGLGCWFLGCFGSSDLLGRCVGALNLGVAVTGVVTTCGYFAGVPARALGVLLGLFALAGLMARTIRWRSWSERPPSALFRSPSLWAFAAAAVLLVAPALTGGLQFTIFQGNHHDMINYLESAMAYSRMPFRQLKDWSPLAIESAGGFSYAQTNLGLRPTVAIVYGVLSWLGPRHFLGNHYVFLVSLEVVAVGSLGLIIRRISAAGQTWQALFLATAVVGGFWGQYILDIDAWSQLAWFPLAAFVLAGAIGTSRPSEAHAQAPSISPSLPWIVCLIGMVYYYPEGTVFFLPPLAVALIVKVVTRGDVRRLPRLVLVALPFALLLLPIYRSNLLLLVQQTGQAMATVDWWKYFDEFLGGRDGFGSGFPGNAIDGAAGAAGVYFVTPAAGVGAVVATAIRASLAVLLLAAVYPAWRHFRDDSKARSAVPVLSAAMGAMVAENLFFIIKDQLWTAGKAFSFYMPMLLACLFAGAMDSFPGLVRMARTAGRLALWLLLGTQIAFGLWRVRAAATPTGIHYLPPYPAIQGRLLKSTFNYGDLSYLKQISPGDEVGLVIENPWLYSVVRMTLCAHGISYHSELPVKANRYSEEMIGKITARRPATVQIDVKVDQSLRFPAYLEVVRLKPVPTLPSRDTPTSP